MHKHLRILFIYKLIDRRKFNILVKKWNMDKGVTRLTTWKLTRTLLNAVVSKISTYREVHMVMGVARSTYSAALIKRNVSFFYELCDQVLLDIYKRAGCRKVRKGLREILAIDSSEITVHGSLFNLPLWQKKRGMPRKASAKLHIVWNVTGEWVEDFLITPGRRNDSRIGLQLRIMQGKTYVFDRAYCDYSFWYKIMKKNSHFVTRIRKVSKKLKNLEKESLKEKSKKCRILHDGSYSPAQGTLSSHPGLPKNIKFRHIIYRDNITGKVFHFSTSDFKSSATEIALIYKKRWGVELLFKWLKGHLDIRYISAKSTNAVKIQIAGAVLAQLLLQLKKLTENFKGTLWELLRLIRSALLYKSLQQTDSQGGLGWKPFIKLHSIGGG